MTEVVQYKYAWNLTDKTGHIKIKLKNKDWSKWIKFSNECEFQIIVSTLRNEKPVIYGKTNNGKYSFQTTEEEVGDGEFY